jgi:hypothetical protein
VLQSGCCPLVNGITLPPFYSTLPSFDCHRVRFVQMPNSLQRSLAWLTFPDRSAGSFMRRERIGLIAPPPAQDKIAEEASKRVLEDDLRPSDQSRAVPISERRQIVCENPRNLNGPAEVVPAALHQDWRVRRIEAMLIKWE